ncbi:MAG: hypothetical protein K9N62_15535 [Verrucomicrobia bacterium]|nr:hypothetical protein [Verrucomicrobiota bacterium]
MKQLMLAFIAWVSLGISAGAAAPRPALLMPSETLFVLSVPDWESAVQAFEGSSVGRLWVDPSFKPFRNKLMAGITEGVVGPMEKELGLKLSEFSGLLRGQLTLAVTQEKGEGAAAGAPGVVLVLDSRQESEALRKLIATLKRKWIDAGRQIKTQRIRDVEFSSLIVRSAELSGLVGAVFQDATGEGNGEASGVPGEELEIVLGQSESLLLIGNSAKTLERVLIRQAGGLVPPLEENPDFDLARADGFADAVAFGWVQFTPIYEAMVRQAVASEAGGGGSPFAPRADKVLEATGLNGLKSLAFRVNSGPDGILGEALVGVPLDARLGIFKALIAEAKDSAPPPFVPGDAVRFSRWRLDGRKAWDTLEAMVTGISPELGALLQMGMATAGKDKDPNFDLRRNLFGNLGDDFIVYEKAPRSTNLEGLGSAASLFLIGSPNAEELARAIKAGTSLLPIAPSEGGDEREFLGRKIYSIPLPSIPSAAGAEPVKRSFSFAASGGYVALTEDTAMLEEFLRAENTSGRPLREVPGLGDASQRVDGMGNGFFGYENQRENMRVLLEALKTDLGRIQQMLGSSDQANDWIDLSLLPPFDAISKYFHFVVYSGRATPRALAWKFFAPTPPAAP